LAASTGSIELPLFLSEAEIALCKQVHLRDELRDKINKSGYASVTVKETYEISRLRAALTICSLKGTALLQNEPINEELFETIGLIVLYRRELEDFMFNFPRLINRFMEIKTGNGLFWQEYTLTQYLFYQSTQRIGLRLDLAYLNTVQLLKDEISLL
jgi:hypothetical protein